MPYLRVFAYPILIWGDYMDILGSFHYTMLENVGI